MLYKKRKKRGPRSEETKRKISETCKGKSFTEETKKKMSEAHEGKKRKPFSEGTKRKMSESHKGKYYSEETKNKMRIKRKGKAPYLGKHHTKETKEKISKMLTGIIPKNKQKGGKWNNIQRGYFNINGKEIFLRSKWEANYALYLDFLIKQKQIKSWTYEKDVFIFEKIKFGTRSYRPDFKVYNLDGTIIYHEVKGYMDSRSKTQIRRMGKYYPEVKLIIIDRDIYGEIKKKLGKMLKFY